MLNTLVSIGNIIVGRLLAGVLTLSFDHPFVLCAILSALAGASCAVLLDMVATRDAMRQPVKAETKQPIRLLRR